MSSTKCAFHELEARYGELLSWCDLPEAIADFLPCHIDERLCGAVADGLLPLLLTSHRLEEQIGSDWLGAIMSGSERSETEDHLEAGRLFNLESAQDVVEVLQALQDGRCLLSFDAVNYLLRSFFCALRRHIAAQRRIIRRIDEPSRAELGMA
jgi:hypothetical protein